MSDNSIGETFVAANQTVLSEEPWLTFGYKKRPTYGAIIQKLRRQWKVRLEVAIRRELFITTIASHVIAGKLAEAQIPDVISFVHKTQGSQFANEYFRVFGYQSSGEAADDIMEMVRKYVQAGTNDWPPMLIDRLEVNALPHKKKASQIIAGCIHHSLIFRDYIAFLRQ